MLGGWVWGGNDVNTVFIFKFQEINLKKVKIRPHIFYTWQDHWSHELIEAVIAIARPEEDQVYQNWSMDVVGLINSLLTEEYCTTMASQEETQFPSSVYPLVHLPLSRRYLHSHRYYQHQKLDVENYEKIRGHNVGREHKSVE